MDTKHNILEHTFDLVMRYGIKSVSMDDISRNIGISKKTIYKYFENKKMLIAEVIENHLDRDEEAIRQIITNSTDAINEVGLIAKHVLQFLRSMSPSMMYDTRKYYPRLWDMIEKRHFSFILDTVHNNIQRGQREGHYETDVDAGIIAKLYIQQILSITDETIFPLSTYEKGDLYKHLVTHHLRGLLNDKGRDIAKNLEF